MRTRQLARLTLSPIPESDMDVNPFGITAPKEPGFGNNQKENTQPFTCLYCQDSIASGKSWGAALFLVAGPYGLTSKHAPLNANRSAMST